MPSDAKTGTGRRRRVIALVVVASAYLVVGLVLDRYGLRDVDGGMDAIVVAGCRVMPSGRPSTALRRRAELAARLWHEGKAPLVVLTGGIGDNPPSEASVAAEVVVAAGVPRTAVRLEEHSTSTEENARLAAEILRGELERDARIIVVSDSYHVFRCERVFGRHFARAVGTGSTGDAWPRVKGSLREVVALSAYAVLGRL